MAGAGRSFLLQQMMFRCLRHRLQKMMTRARGDFLLQ